MPELRKVYVDFVPSTFTEHISNLFFPLMIDSQIFHSSHSNQCHIYATEIYFFFLHESPFIPQPPPHTCCEHIHLCFFVAQMFWILQSPWCSLHGGKLSDRSSGTLSYFNDGSKNRVCQKIKCKKSKVLDWWEAISDVELSVFPWGPRKWAADLTYFIVMGLDVPEWFVPMFIEGKQPIFVPHLFLQL